MGAALTRALGGPSGRPPCPASRPAEAEMLQRCLRPVSESRTV